MKGRVPQTIAAILIAAASLLAGTTSSAAGPADPIVEILGRIDKSDAIGLEAWLDGSAPDQVRVGDEVSFRFRSEKDAYLTTLYVDAAGAITVIFSGGEPHRLPAGQVRHFPPEGGGQRMLAQPPLGAEFVFAIATLEPLPQDIFTNAERKLVLVHERPEDGRHLAQRLADYVSILPEGSVDVAWFSQEVVPENTPRRYSTTTIVQHFTTRTRSLTRPKLDLDIQFEFGSDRLTETARQDLDELGRALQHPAMKSRRFELAGHTDDVGSETYNMTLSQKRAQAARSYLLEKYAIAPETLRPAGYGEAQPLAPGTTDEARRRNRRVVIEQLP
jgi:outer membrane protein OmpA-like peptidoglycan-associated protein